MRFQLSLATLPADMSSSGKEFAGGEGGGGDEWEARMEDGGSRIERGSRKRSGC